MKIQYIILLILLLPLATALNSVHKIEFVDFENDTLESKFYIATINRHDNITFNLSECKQLCLNQVALDYTPKFNSFLYACIGAVILGSLSVIGFLIHNENLAFYGVMGSLASYLVGAIILII